MNEHSAEEERDSAVYFIRCIAEELDIAGYPGGDRDTILRNLRYVLGKYRDAIEKTAAPDATGEKANPCGRSGHLDAAAHTPRTDAVAGYCVGDGYENRRCVDAKECKKLERELSAAQKENADLRADLAKCLSICAEQATEIEDLRRQRDVQWAARKEAQAALSALRKSMEGKVLVSFEHTQQMVKAGVKSLHGDAVYKCVSNTALGAMEADIKDIYADMLRAAQKEGK